MINLEFPLRLILIAGVALTVPCEGAAVQLAPSSATKLRLRAALVQDSEFCATKIKKNHETFELGRAACDILQSSLEQEYITVTTIAAFGDAEDAQIVLVPKFVDAVATKGMGAFATRELTVMLEWTIKDKSGRTIWIDTVQGSGKNHMGNGFTYKKDLKEIIRYAMQDLANNSVAEMDASPELHKLALKAVAAQ